MDFSIPVELKNEVSRFRSFLKERMTPGLSQWYEQREVPRSFHQAMGAEGWYNFYLENGVLTRQPILRSVAEDFQHSCQIVDGYMSVSLHISVCTYE